MLPQALVEETIIISDMYDLNEYMALELLIAGKDFILCFSLSKQSQFKQNTIEV